MWPTWVVIFFSATHKFCWGWKTKKIKLSLFKQPLTWISNYSLYGKESSYWWNGGKMKDILDKKKYNPAKPEKNHIKNFGLCNSVTSYIYNSLV